VQVERRYLPAPGEAWNRPSTLPVDRSSLDVVGAGKTPLAATPLLAKRVKWKAAGFKLLVQIILAVSWLR